MRLLVPDWDTLMLEHQFSEAEYVTFLYQLRGRHGPRDDEPPVKAERSFWRDLVLLQKHRGWGYDVPGEDIDFLEYDNCRPVALFEFKMRKNDWQTCDVVIDANLKAMTQLADMARLPLFVTVYPESRAEFRVVAINHFAKQRLANFG